MTQFEKEIDLINMITEDADERIVAEFYTESVGEAMKSVAAKAVETIKKIIKSLKELAQKIKLKLNSAKTVAVLKKAMNEKYKKIAFTLNEKEIAVFQREVDKTTIAAIKEARKIHDTFMSHKINYQTFLSKMDKLENDLQNKMSVLVSNDRFYMNREKGSAKATQYTMNEVARYGLKLQNMVEKSEREIWDSAYAEEDRLLTEAEQLIAEEERALKEEKKARIKNVVKSAGKGITRLASSAKVRTANFISKVARMAQTEKGKKVGIILASVVSALAAGLGLYAAGTKKGKRAANA